MKRFGLLMLVAIFTSALSIGTFNVLKVQTKLITDTELVSSISTQGSIFSFNQQGDVVSPELVDFSEDKAFGEGHFSSLQQAFYSCYHQQDYLQSFNAFFDNQPFSDIYRSTV